MVQKPAGGWDEAGAGASLEKVVVREVNVVEALCSECVDARIKVESEEQDIARRRHELC